MLLPPPKFEHPILLTGDQYNAVAGEHPIAIRLCPEIEAWLDHSVGHDNYEMLGLRLYFREKAQAALFRLFWGGDILGNY